MPGREEDVGRRGRVYANESSGGKQSCPLSDDQQCNNEKECIYLAQQIIQREKITVDRIISNIAMSIFHGEARVTNSF